MTGLTDAEHEKRRSWVPLPSEEYQRAHPDCDKATANGADDTGNTGDGGKRKGLYLLWVKDMALKLVAGGTLIKGLLDEGAMSVVYGPSNVGKSFFCLDIAFHIAMFMSWRDHRIKKQGCVVYLAAEGGVGIVKRVEALKLKHEISADLDIPFAAIPCPVNLLDPKADRDKIIDLIREAEKATKLPCVLVVIDTLSRAMAGGNENGPEDMTGFVGNVDTIRAQTGAHCTIVHHTGKDPAKGARGHTSLLAATDTEIEISFVGDPKDKRAVACVTKQRDMEGGEEFRFRVHGMLLGRDEDGAAVTSAVAVPDEEQGTKGRKPKLKGKNALGMSVLETLLANEGAPPPPEAGTPTEAIKGVTVPAWRREFHRRLTDSQPNARRMAFNRMVEALQEAKLIGLCDGWVWLTRT